MGISSCGDASMTYVVGSGCIGCKHTTCVSECPVDAFHEGANFLVINPDECINCDLCVAACPEDAIFPDDEMPADQVEFIQINADYSQIWPVIAEEKAPLLDGSTKIIYI